MVIINKNTTISRDDFTNILNENKGIVIFKFGADWCKPCKVAEPFINKRLESSSDYITYYEIDVDNSFDLYAFLKSKKMVSGIPTMLAYIKDNKTFVSNYCVMSANEKEINIFFNYLDLICPDL